MEPSVASIEYKKQKIYLKLGDKKPKCLGRRSSGEYSNNKDYQKWSYC